MIDFIDNFHFIWDYFIPDTLTYATPNLSAGFRHASQNLYLKHQALNKYCENMPLDLFPYGYNPCPQNTGW